MEDSLKHFETKQAKPVSVSSSKFIGKVFLYTFFGLLITAITAAIIGIIFSRAIQPVNYNEYVLDAELLKPYIVLLIISIVTYIPLLLYIYIACFRFHRSMGVPFVLYAIIMGVLISSFTMFVPIELIAISFGLTCGVFGILSLIGLKSKKDLSFLGLVAFGIFLGALFITLFNLIWMFIFPETFASLYWIVSFAIFFAMMLITIVDVWRVKKIAQSGEQSNNVALYCAFNLYVDFIYLFIRILYFVVMIYSRSKR